MVSEDHHVHELMAYPPKLEVSARAPARWRNMSEHLRDQEIFRQPDADIIKCMHAESELAEISADTDMNYDHESKAYSDDRHQ